MKKLHYLSVTLVAGVILAQLISCGGPINTNFDPHFTDNGYLIKDTTKSDFADSFTIINPLQVKFFIEVSGSMNGFFRANQPTDFKTDVWNIVNYYSRISPNVCILTNDGTQGANLSLGQFQTGMNTGAFVSAASTKVPLMLKTILQNINADAGEVAVLISDMKYDPVGQAAPQVLLQQYTTDISKILGEFGQSVSLIGATSSYLDRTGKIVCEQSPYYYLLLGNPECVAFVRNQISTLLQRQNHFIDNIESGFNFGYPQYTFGITNYCYQLDNEPAFIAYQEADEYDTCSVQLKIELQNYRWRLADKLCLENAFNIKSLYGSNVQASVDTVIVENITGNNYDLIRKATAVVKIRVFDMPLESDVLQWRIELPDVEYTLFSPYFDGATNTNDYTKSFSVINFVRGMFQGSVVNTKLPDNYILISKNN